MVTKKTSSTTKAETATVKAEKKETAAAKAIETKKDTTKKLCACGRQCGPGAGH